MPPCQLIYTPAPADSDIGVEWFPTRKCPWRNGLFARSLGVAMTED